jgi:hypothetical protein
MVMVLSHLKRSYNRDHHFAAIAADNTSVELRPTMASWNIHDYLLPMWGTPVGELFDLEPLSQLCQKLGRYSFFVTSAPLNVFGGIASTHHILNILILAPPNCLAVF